MHLYHLTLQRSSGITHAIYGSFSGAGEQEIVISRGKSLELLRLDELTGRLITILAFEVFGTIRSLIPFQILNDSKDYVAVGSDSDRLVILRYVAAKNTFEKVYQDILYNSGCRRTIPGQYLAADPMGRCIMSGAVEKQKLVYNINVDNLRLSVPSILEAHRNNTLIFHIVALDVGFNYPLFACLEIDYEESDKDLTGEAAKRVPQTLSFYKQDLKMNQIERIYCRTLEEHANFLIPLPGRYDGPSGVLICSENYLSYTNIGNQPTIRCPIPRRRNDLDEPERGLLFVSSACYKTASLFFVLIQTEQGDIFRVTLGSKDDIVTEIKLKYFDTVPVASSMCIFKTGFLFVASEFGNHHFYQIIHTGDDDDEPEFSSSLSLEEGETFFFAPRPLRNLVLVEEIDSLSPIMDCHVADLANEGTSQLYVVCGRGPRSTLRVLRHGLEVSEISVSELRGNPTAVWTIKKRVSDDFDSYIIVSFLNSTMVLSIGDTLEEISNSGLSTFTSTLVCSNMGVDTVIQVYPSGFKLLYPDKRHQDWKVPSKKQIIKCAVNQRQLILALTGGTLAYFVLDSMGQLQEVTQRKEVGSDILCLGLANAASGDLSRFVIVGISDNSVIIVSLDYSNCLNRVALLTVPCWPESVCIIETSGEFSASGFYLNIGLRNGTLLQTILDPVTGDLTDTRTRYLGARPVKLFTVRAQGRLTLLAMCSRTWLSYRYQNRFHLTPLSYDPLECASGFSSKQYLEGVVATSSNTLRILSLEKFDTIFSQISYPLEYTPKKLLVHQETGNMIIIESDHNVYTEDAKAQKRLLMAKEMGEMATEAEKEIALELAQDFLNDDLPEKIFGTPKAGTATWASLIRIINPLTGETKSLTRLEQNEAALSMTLVKFSNQPDNGVFLVVGVAKDYVLNPRQISSAYLNTYRLTSNCAELELIHRTVVDDLPMAMCAFHGQLIVGVGKLLRLYDMGKKKLLKKCESKNIPNMIVRVETMGRRIFVYDVQESVFFIRYKVAENQFVIFADDTQARWIVTSTVLDYNTVAVCDKFGNMNVIRIDTSICDDADEDPNCTKTVWDRGLLNSVSQKADYATGFHIGEIVKSIQKTSLVPGGCESLLYTTLSGSIGLFVPLSSHEDQDFFQLLERCMRSKHPPFVGRDHVLFRSYYYPLKNVVDGDLCEQFPVLEQNKQQSVSQELCKASNFIMKKLEEIRFRYAF